MSAPLGSLDANVVLRLLVKDIPEQHAQARELVSRGVHAVHLVALAEVCFVLGRHYGLDRTRQAAALRGFVALPAIACEAAVVAAALDVFVARPKLSFEDCLLAAVARHRGEGPLWTFDRKLARQTDARLVGAPEGDPDEG